MQAGHWSLETTAAIPSSAGARWPGDKMRDAEPFGAPKTGFGATKRFVSRERTDSIRDELERLRQRPIGSYGGLGGLGAQPALQLRLSFLRKVARARTRRALRSRASGAPCERRPRAIGLARPQMSR